MSKAVVGGVMETGLNDGLCFDQLEVGSSMSIVFMVCRSWDCDNVHGRYMSTDYIFSDRNGDSIHATARSNIAHYFVDKLKEGCLYLLKNITVVKNRHAYRVLKDSQYMIELGGHVAVTLWGKLGESFIAQKAKKAGVYTIILSLMSSLALSSSSSTLIIDSNNIPLLESFNASLRGIDLRAETQPARDGPHVVTTIAELLQSARQDKKKDMTGNVVVVLFDEAGEKLVKKSAKSLLDEQELSTNSDDMALPEALRCLIGGTYMFELRSHTYYQYGEYESFSCAQVLLPGSASYASSSSVDDILEPVTVPALSLPVKKAPQFGVVTPDKRADKRSSNLEGVPGKAGHALSMDVKTDSDVGFEVNVAPGKRLRKVTGSETQDPVEGTPQLIMDPLSEQEDDVDDKDCGEDSGAGTVGKKRFMACNAL
ncbi:hypothetical protein SSX86_029953 [Deinandra increscens subsp. villosa]|uniref:Replication protein A 70 kDa DNA-binding subunit B/D first OB fold domain-containing protein n=1 Tax=Deinandra increscens subsp. villosa TaxID=3103831 RepID=A0AAP0CBI7_9ASTR